MNAIIALCHFCDYHGPTTLFCTQAFKYSDYQQLNTNKQDDGILLLDSAPPSQSPNITKIPNLSSSPNDLSYSPTSNCKACRVFEKSFHHYISYDETSCLDNSSNQICYISQSNPNDSEVFSLVRKACLRTLHCEVFEDPIYFDDDKNGSVIGYEFNVKDIEGRGVQRSYSLLIIMKDRIYLQHLWSFLSQQMSLIANNIKVEAEKKFQKDMLEKGLSPPPGSLSNGSQFLNFKKTSKQARGLIELTDDPMIFAKLHMWFTWILRMSSCQITEEFMHGPLTEDSQVKCENEKLKEFSMQINGFKHVFENDDFESTLPKVESLRHFYQLVGAEKFHQIAYNVIIGNQVIIRGKCEQLVNSIVRVLEELVPLGCCKPVRFSHKYLKSYECKLLGLSDKINLFTNSTETHVLDDLNEFLLINLNEPTQNEENFQFKINFKVFTNVNEITQVPSILNKIEGYLSNEDLDDKSIESLVRLAKEEWLNKTKVFYKYLLSPNVKNSISCETVLKMLNLTSNDELALKYWQAGLSHECKVQIRTC